MASLEFTYGGELVRVIDGDTIIVKVDLGFNIKRTITCRLMNIDAPEVRGEEKVDGLKVKKYTEELLGDTPLVVRTTSKGKYGRWLADIWTVDDLDASINEKIHKFYTALPKNDNEGE